MNEPRVISLAERRPRPPGVPDGPARLHGLLVELAPDSYWTGTQAQLAAQLPREDGEPVSERTVRDWLRWLEDHRVVATRAAWRQGMTYFVLGPLPANLPPTVPPTSAHPSAHTPSRARETSSSSSSPLPGSGSAQPSAFRPSVASGDPSPFMAGRLLAIGIDPVPELLDVMGRLSRAEQAEVFARAGDYAARTPLWLLKTADTVRLLGLAGALDRGAPLTAQGGAGEVEGLSIPRCPLHPLLPLWRVLRALGWGVLRGLAK